MLCFALVRRNRFQFPSQQPMIKTPQLTGPPRRSEDRGAWLKAGAARVRVHPPMDYVTCFWMPFGVTHTRTR